MELASYHPSDSWNVDMVPRFMENVRTPDIYIIQFNISYGLDNPEFEFRQGQDIFHFSKNVQTSSGAQHPPIQYVMEFLPWDKAARA